MPFTFTMPKLSPTMEEGTITKWHKNEGDYVNAGDVLLEVATDKATVEHSALDEGWLRKILIPEGRSAIINQPLAIFTEEKDESIANYQPKGAAPEQVAAAPQAESPAYNQEKPVQRSASLSQPAFTPEPPLPFSPSIETQYQSPASPLARKLAKERNLDLSTVQGSGSRRTYHQQRFKCGTAGRASNLWPPRKTNPCTW